MGFDENKLDEYRSAMKLLNVQLVYLGDFRLKISLTETGQYRFGLSEPRDVVVADRVYNTDVARIYSGDWDDFKLKVVKYFNPNKVGW